MARGCDSAAHKGALSKGGTTIAVLGTGIDMAYPRENEGLYNDIAQSGLLVSEFPLGTAPYKGNFPQRNRIVSGLSLGVFVAEAPVRSGAMMTARFALEEGRDVFAIPGPVSSPKSAGTNKLLKEGAYLVEEANDIIEPIGLGGLLQASIKDTKPAPPLLRGEKLKKDFGKEADNASLILDTLTGRGRSNRPYSRYNRPSCPKCLGPAPRYGTKGIYRARARRGLRAYRRLEARRQPASP